MTPLSPRPSRGECLFVFALCFFAVHSMLTLVVSFPDTTRAFLIQVGVCVAMTALATGLVAGIYAWRNRPARTHTNSDDSDT